MKKRIHVNQHLIKSNKKNKKNVPVLTCKTYKENRLGHSVRINGPSVVVYSPDKPLPCGATVWIETDADVEVINENSLFNLFSKK